MNEARNALADALAHLEQDMANLAIQREILRDALRRIERSDEQHRAEEGNLTETAGGEQAAQPRARGASRAAVLNALEGGTSRRLTDIATAAQVSPGAASGLLRTLIRNGLVQRGAQRGTYCTAKRRLNPLDTIQIRSSVDATRPTPAVAMSS